MKDSLSLFSEEQKDIQFVTTISSQIYNAVLKKLSQLELEQQKENKNQQQQQQQINQWVAMYKAERKLFVEQLNRIRDEDTVELYKLLK